MAILAHSPQDQTGIAMAEALKQNAALQSFTLSALREVGVAFVHAEDELDKRTRTSLEGNVSDEEDAPTATPKSEAERAQAAREKAAKEKAEEAASKKAAKERGGKP